MYKNVAVMYYSYWPGTLKYFTCSAGSSDGKESAYNSRDLDPIPGFGISPEEGHGYPLQYSCLENPMGREAWWATVHRTAKSWTQLSDEHFHFFI